MHNRVLLTVGPMLYSTYLELIPLYKCNFRPIKQLSSSSLHLLKLHKYSQCIIIQFLPIALYSSLLYLCWLIFFWYTGLHAFHPIPQAHFCNRIFTFAVPPARRALLLTFHIFHISHISHFLNLNSNITFLKISDYST